jgi:predicted aspartyl protease
VFPADSLSDPKLYLDDAEPSFFYQDDFIDTFACDSTHSPGILHASLHIGGYIRDVVIDTGAAVSLISPVALTQMRTRRLNNSQLPLLRAADSKSMTPTEAHALKIHLSRDSHQVTCYLLPSLPFPVLLGMDFLQQMHAVIDLHSMNLIFLLDPQKPISVPLTTHSTTQQHRNTVALSSRNITLPPFTHTWATVDIAQPMHQPAAMYQYDAAFVSTINSNHSSHGALVSSGYINPSLRHNTIHIANLSGLH